MPVAAAIPAITAGAGLLGSAFGRSGKQGGSQFDQSGMSNETGSQTSTRSGASTSQQTEDPSLAPFRQMLMGAFGGALSDAQRPAFGNSEIANIIQNINQASNAASKSLTGRLARTGSLDSGRAAVGQGLLEQGRAGQITGFLSQVPQLNRQARQQALNPLLSLGLGFTGRGPQGVTTTTNDTASNMFDSTRQFDQSGVSAQQGAPWWRNLLSDAGGFGQTFAADRLGWLDN